MTDKGIALTICGMFIVCLLLAFTKTIVTRVTDHEYRMAQIECAPQVCRTEHGQRKECDNE